jgi:hypothetical protein
MHGNFKYLSDWKPNRKFLRAQMGYFGQTSLKQKSHASVTNSAIHYGEF